MDNFLHGLSQRLDSGLEPVSNVIESEQRRLLGDCFNCVKECYLRESDDDVENEECIEYCRDRAFLIQTEIQEKMISIQKFLKKCSWDCYDDKTKTTSQTESCLKLCTENTIWEFMKLQLRFQDLNKIRFQHDSTAYSMNANN